MAFIFIEEDDLLRLGLSRGPGRFQVSDFRLIMRIGTMDIAARPFVSNIQAIEHLPQAAGGVHPQPGKLCISVAKVQRLCRWPNRSGARRTTESKACCASSAWSYLGGKSRRAAPAGANG